MIGGTDVPPVPGPRAPAAAAARNASPATGRVRSPPPGALSRTNAGTTSAGVSRSATGIAATTAWLGAASAADALETIGRKCRTSRGSPSAAPITAVVASAPTFAAIGAPAAGSIPTIRPRKPDRYEPSDRAIPEAPN